MGILVDAVLDVVVVAHTIDGISQAGEEVLPDFSQRIVDIGIEVMDTLSIVGDAVC